MNLIWVEHNLLLLVILCKSDHSQHFLMDRNGPNYIDSPYRLVQLKNDFVLNPKFILFWGCLPFWFEKFYLPPNVPCPHMNCYYTDSRTMFDPTSFHAVVFMAEFKIDADNIPKRRLPQQKYIFFTQESSANFPKTEPIHDNFYNWTWTYKFGSTVHWPYFHIFNTKGKMVGPKKHMKWIKNMDPINEILASKLSSKKRAAAWVVSKCKTKSNRGRYGLALSISLKLLGLRLDVYGKCGKPEKYCKSITDGNCSAKITRDYYFYLAFENSFAEDYVTEKLMHALINYAVPVVYGGAHYPRFLPKGSYLNARKYTPFELAVKMKKIIENRTTYNKFFRWRNHYIYRFASDLAEVPCRFCSALNNSSRMKQTTTIGNFTKWWNT